jgi:hypothetical protein
VVYRRVGCWRCRSRSELCQFKPVALVLVQRQEPCQEWQ